MKAKLILLGGVSSSGKTAICSSLNQRYSIENKRLHNYVLAIANEENLGDLSSEWDNLAPEAMRRLVEDVKLEKIVTCDIHFAVQPILDTAYALGREYVEDINEPYVKGVNDRVLQISELSEIELYMLFVDSNVDEVLKRRKDSAEVKKPRSLNPRSIGQEIEFERKYFEEAADVASEYTTLHVYIIRNKECSYEATLKQIEELCELGDKLR